MTKKIDADEKDLVKSVERGEWKSGDGGRREPGRYARYVRATFRKDRRLNIPLSTNDLEVIQERALAECLPYHTLIASLLHKYASGRLNEVWFSAVHRPRACPESATAKASAAFGCFGHATRAAWSVSFL
jgi:predicted DNA binding CopG/RHH family protein